MAHILPPGTPRRGNSGSAFRRPNDRTRRVKLNPAAQKERAGAMNRAGAR